MEQWLLESFDWLPTGGVYYALIGVISFLESLAVIGILCPGSILIVFAGFLAAHGKGDFSLLVAVAAAGAHAGDRLS
jgi:membrane protein DedA with SNARE-associated domain